MSNAILEAMSAGKPVIATAVGGNPELVEDGKTGYLVPPGDVDSMAAALGRLLTDRDLARRMGECGRARVEREFGVPKMVDHYEDILQYIHLRKTVRKGKWAVSGVGIFNQAQPPAMPPNCWAPSVRP